MFKTCISVASVGKAPDIVKKIIDDNGLAIATIIIELDRVSFYVRYKWYQYYKVCAFKKAVKRCEERNKYYYKPDIYGKSLSQETRQPSDKFQKALAEFSYTAAVQGSIRCGDIEAIVIGYKR